MIEAEHERLRLPREGAGEGHSDAVTFAFGEGEAELFGLARIGLQPREGSAATGSALALLFSAGEVVTALAEGDVEVAEPSWADVAVDGLRMETTEPLRAWRVALDAAGSGFDPRSRGSTTRRRSARSWWTRARPRTRRRCCGWPSRGCPRPMTRRADSAGRDWSCGWPRRTSCPAGRPARWRAGRRWSWGGCGFTARSSTGAWRGGWASAATTS